MAQDKQSLGASAHSLFSSSLINSFVKQVFDAFFWNRNKAVLQPFTHSFIQKAGLASNLEVCIDSEGWACFFFLSFIAHSTLLQWGRLLAMVPHWPLWSTKGTSLPAASSFQTINTACSNKKNAYSHVNNNNNNNDNIKLKITRSTKSKTSFFYCSGWSLIDVCAECQG